MTAGVFSVGEGAMPPAEEISKQLDELAKEIRKAIGEAIEAANRFVAEARAALQRNLTEAKDLARRVWEAASGMFMYVVESCRDWLISIAQKAQDILKGLLPFKTLLEDKRCWFEYRLPLGAIAANLNPLELTADNLKWGGDGAPVAYFEAALLQHKAADRMANVMKDVGFRAQTIAWAGMGMYVNALGILKNIIQIVGAAIVSLKTHSWLAAPKILLALLVEKFDMLVICTGFVIGFFALQADMTQVILTEMQDTTLFRNGNWPVPNTAPFQG